MEWNQDHSISLLPRPIVMNGLDEHNEIGSLRVTLANRERRSLNIGSVNNAGVLFIIFDRYDKKHILFTKRSQSVGRHKGEISLPGGVFDRNEGDVSILDTAIRETKEEIGISIDHSSIIGELDDVPTHVSDFIITPFIAYLDNLPPLSLNYHEIDSLVEVPLDGFFQDKVFSRENVELNGRKMMLDFFRIDGNVIWGSTGAILRQFLDLLRTPINQ